jgi:pimeloyl-ACP methyl ester carboxylesterase
VKIVLVHGSYHGPWCWDLLTPELERLGHEVVSVDLPVSDPAAGAAAYADAIFDQVDWTEPPVLVAHSMAGLVIPLVAGRQAVSRMVFLAAFLPRPGMSATEQRQVEPIDSPIPPQTAEWTDLGDGVWMVGPDTARELFFQDASADVAEWAIGHLRPQSYRVMTEVSPLVEWPSPPSSYIVCRDDHALNPDWARQAARERLGVEPTELDGGHSPFLTRPAELAEVLHQLVS